MNENTKRQLLANTTHSDSDVVKEALAALGTLAQTDPEVRAAALNALPSVKADYFSVLDKSPYEVPALRSALRDGLVDGTTYDGPCGCLLTTLAHARNCRYNQIPGLRPDASRPSEQFFLKINKGDTTKTNGFSLLADVWADEYMAKHPEFYPASEKMP